MRNLFTYHATTSIPVLVFFTYWIYGDQSSVDLILFGLLYTYAYRPVLDYYRLKAIGKIEEEDFWKMWKWAGLYRFKYYSALMFGK